MNKINPQPNKKWKLLIGSGVLIVIVIFVIFWKKDKFSQKIYNETSPKRGDLTVSILSTGVVQPENRLEIKPPISGRAEKVLVDAGSIVREGQILVWMSSTERAALLDAARARGLKELKSWEDYYKATPVLAPINGTIIQRNIQPGQTFGTSDAILVMSDRLTVQAQVDETDIAQIKLKQRAVITLDAYPDTTIPAHVDKIAYDAKTVNNVTTYVVNVLPEEIPPFMRSGMTSNISFQIQHKSDVLTLASEGIKKRPDGTAYVMLNGASQYDSPSEREVKTGITDGKKTEILSGIAEGDIILIPQLKIEKNSPRSNPLSPFSSKKKSAR